MHIIYLSIFIIIILLLAYIDAKTLYLPNVLTLSLWALGLAINNNAIFIPIKTALLSSLLCFTYLYCITLVYKKIRNKDGLGGGDIKLLAAFSAWFGFYPTLLCIIIACLFAIPIRIFCYLKRGRKALISHFAFGPYLISGMLVFIFLCKPY